MASHKNLNEVTDEHELELLQLKCVGTCMLGREITSHYDYYPAGKKSNLSDAQQGAIQAWKEFPRIDIGDAYNDRVFHGNHRFQHAVTDTPTPTPNDSIINESLQPTAISHSLYSTPVAGSSPNPLTAPLILQTTVPAGVVVVRLPPSTRALASITPNQNNATGLITIHVAAKPPYVVSKELEVTDAAFFVPGTVVSDSIIVRLPPCSGALLSHTRNEDNFTCVAMAPPQPHRGARFATTAPSTLIKAVEKSKEKLEAEYVLVDGVEVEQEEWELV